MRIWLLFVALIFFFSSNVNAQLDSTQLQLKEETKGYPVKLLKDSLFSIYTKHGALLPQKRAEYISNNIRELYENDFLIVDSIKAVDNGFGYDIVYGDTIVFSISDRDALWFNQSKQELAQNYLQIIKASINSKKIEQSIPNQLYRMSIVVGICILVLLFIILINKVKSKIILTLTAKKEVWFKELKIKNYTLLDVNQVLSWISKLIVVIKWVFIIIALLIALPFIFGIFPETREWSAHLIALFTNPINSILRSIWSYLPNLITILVIVVVMQLVIRLVKYIFTEIQEQKLILDDFHADWAMPTYNIIRILLYAFMFVIIFPYLPGSDSPIFKGVSVLLGLLLSIGSSSVISNLIAGLVITYMRPFKVGDRIKISEMTGDVIEKTMLVTRLKTIKNEEITIPNSAILSGNTINYSSFSSNQGLIIHTTVTIGYDVPWKEMHQALIDAALKTEMILHEPLPFVLQTSLDDFYVSYQINAYTNESKRQATIKSSLHQNLQDICNERGIEIMSPHYRAQRDGNKTTIPEDYLGDDYKVPSFNVTSK